MRNKPYYTDNFKPKRKNYAELVHMEVFGYGFNPDPDESIQGEFSPKRPLQLKSEDGITEYLPSISDHHNLQNEAARIRHMFEQDRLWHGSPKDLEGMILNVYLDGEGKILSVRINEELSMVRDAA